jgi:hypothetical protein
VTGTTFGYFHDRATFEIGLSDRHLSTEASQHASTHLDSLSLVDDLFGRVW